MNRLRLGVAGSAACALVVVAASGALASDPKTRLTSVGPQGQVVHGSSTTYGVSLSGDGRLAVFAANDDALPGAAGTMDVYVNNRKSGKTKLVSQSSSGEPADQTCGDGAAISLNGRYIAFRCAADNLGGGAAGAFVRDLRRGTTRLASRTSSGDPADGGADDVGISGDGRFLVFQSMSTNLPGTPGTANVYVRDLKKDRTKLVSRTSDGTPVDDFSQYPSISANGRFVVFWSGSDLLPGGLGTNDVYERDLRRGRTVLASRASNGDPANGNSSPALGAISDDGRFVVFESSAANLGATLNHSVVVHDMKTGKSRLASRTGNGGVADGGSASISANGRFVGYESDDNDLPGLPGVTDVYRYDLKKRRTALISKSSGGVPGDANSFYASVDASGGFVAFSSFATNLSGVDDDAALDTFVRGPLP